MARIARAIKSPDEALPLSPIPEATATADFLGCISVPWQSSIRPGCKPAEGAAAVAAVAPVAAMGVAVFSPAGGAAKQGSRERGITLVRPPRSESAHGLIA